MLNVDDVAVAAAAAAVSFDYSAVLKSQLKVIKSKPITTTIIYTIHAYICIFIAYLSSSVRQQLI